MGHPRWGGLRQQLPQYLAQNSSSKRCLQQTADGRTRVGHCLPRPPSPYPAHLPFRSRSGVVRWSASELEGGAQDPGGRVSAPSLRGGAACEAGREAVVGGTRHAGLQCKERRERGTRCGQSASRVALACVPRHGATPQPATSAACASAGAAAAAAAATAQSR